MTRAEAIEELQYIKDSLVSCELSYDALDMAIESLSADVRENVKGEWKREVLGSTSGYGTTVMYQCSACERMSISEYNYCPNCGAYMRGEKNV